MKVTLDPKTTQEFHKVLEFTAGELLEVVLSNNGEEFAKDNQRLTDIVLDLFSQVDLNAIVRDKLKKMLETK